MVSSIAARQEDSLRKVHAKSVVSKRRRHANLQSCEQGLVWFSARGHRSPCPDSAALINQARQARIKLKIIKIFLQGKFAEAD